MIVNASCRTDIPAFFSTWFLNRLKAGYFDVRNPFARQKVSRIFVEDIDAFMFCTKNPLPLIDHLQEIEKPILMDVTITPYHQDFEPNVIDKKKIIEGLWKMNKILGKESLSVRYDLIILSDRYPVEYHLRAFEKLCSLVEGCVESISISFLDDYKNVRKNAHELAFHQPTPEELEAIGKGFAKSAARHHLEVFTCCEKGILAEYGIPEGGCFSMKKAYAMTGKVFKKWKARDCECVEMADIGVYNTCSHLCRYCYANYDENAIRRNIADHDPNSSLLVGHLGPGDEIKRRKP